MTETTISTEQLAAGLLDDYNRARNAILKLRASFEKAAALPVAQRCAVGELLDPVGKLLAGRAPDGPSRKLIYSDFGELITYASLVRDAAGRVLERFTVLGDPIPTEEPQPRVIPPREPKKQPWEMENNSLMEYGIGWTPGPDGNIHNI